MCQVPKIQFADLLELIVRTGALDVDYLRPKKQPPADGLGRGRVTEYEVLQDAIKSELLSIDDKGAGAQNASLDFGEFLEFVGAPASRRVEAPSRHRRASSPGEQVVGGLFVDFEAVRTESRDRDAPRRSLGAAGGVRRLPPAEALVEFN